MSQAPAKQLPVKLFNTLSRDLEVLKPLEKNNVKLYCCGPTVYNFQHIGNLRTYIFEDLLVRTLRYAGYQVKHVMNITDVGHLVSDADEGEDKMAVASKREGKTSAEIAEYYTEIFFKHCSWLNINKPDVVCKATEHISQMIELIKKLEKNDIAYQSGGNIYFDVSKFKKYGELAKLDLEKLQSGARIEVDSNKRSPLDFALWFTKSKFENQELQWDSPWGRGYPGWHIECSAMAMKHLGETCDIHCGGIDHIPVHHTNEIAQSEAATGKIFAKIWMHGGFLVAEKEKMSKSKGDFLTLDLLKEKGFDPIAYRLFCLGTHYRNELNWSWQALEGSANSLNKIKAVLDELRSQSTEKPSSYSAPALKLISDFDEAISNDLGLPKALAVFHETLSSKNIEPNEKLGLVLRFDQIFGLGIDTWKTEKLEIPTAVKELASAREEARANKDWAESDRLRNEISKLDYVVEDGPAGQILKLKN